VGQAAGWIPFTAYRIKESLLAPSVFQDSEAYHAVAAHPWLSTALWTGSRAPGTPVLLKMLGDNYSRYELFEVILGALAWGFLAWTAASMVPAGWRALVVSWAVLGFATAPLVVGWDWTALTESPSLSCLALLCAFGLWLVRRFTWVRLLGLGVAALWYAALRDADIWDMTMVGIVLVAVGVTRVIRGAAVSGEAIVPTMRRNLPRAWRPLVVGAVLVAVSGTAGLAASVSHRNVLNIEEVFYVRIFPFPDRVAWFSDHGMPMGQPIDSAAAAAPVYPGQAKVVSLPITDPQWKPLADWFAADGLSTYARYLVTNPAYVLLAPFASPPLTYNNASGQLQFYVPPGRSLPVFETVFVPSCWVVGALALVAVLLASALGTIGLATWRFMVVFSAVGLVSMLLAWHGEGQEVTRHMVEGSVEVRLGVLLTLLLALFGADQRSAPSTNPLVGTPVPAVTTT